MYHIEWPIFIIAILSEVFGTASGLGSSILFLPLAQYYEEPHTVMVLTAILHVFGNSVKVYLFWDSSLLKLLKKYLPIYLLSASIGAGLSIYTDPPQHKLIMGIMLIGFALFTFSNMSMEHFRNLRVQRGLMALSGLTTGWLGTGGAIREMALLTLQLKKNEFVFLTSSIDVGGDVLRAIIYLYNNYLEMEHLFYIPLLALAAWIGSRIGKVLLGLIPQRLFEFTVAVFIFVIGSVSVYQFFYVIP